MIDVRRHLKDLIYCSTKANHRTSKADQKLQNASSIQKGFWIMLRHERTAFAGTSLAAQKARNEIIKIKVVINGW